MQRNGVVLVSSVAGVESTVSAALRQETAESFILC